MKRRTPKPEPTPTDNPATDRLSFRMDESIANRFVEVVRASKRTKTSIIEECLEVALPMLEKQYRKAA